VEKWVTFSNDFINRDFTPLNPKAMKAIANSLNMLIDFESVDFQENDVSFSITQIPGAGAFITINNVDYFKNHVNMHSEAWENFLFRLLHDDSYRSKHVVNKRWHGRIAS
jgi:hypothetical protein